MEERTAAAVYRGMIVMACLFACIAAVNYMQSLFDKGDMKRAMHVVRDFRGASGQTIAEALQAKHAPEVNGEIAWEIGIQSSCYGVMRVTATVPRKDNNPQVYRFDVDLVKNGIHPADDHGRELLMEMNDPERNAPPPDAVPPSEGDAPPSPPTRSSP